MVLLTLAGSWLSSHWGTIHEVSTAPAGDAKSCLSPVREGSSSAEWATGLLLRAALALGTRPGSSRAGPLGGESTWSPWSAWWPEESGRSGEARIGEHWTSRGPEHLAVSRSMLGSESCLLRQRGRPLPSRRLTRSLEPSEGVAPIRLGLHCLWAACPHQGSICPAHEPPLTRGVLSVPKRGGDEPSCKECVTWDRLGDWYKPPPSCCLTGPRRGGLLKG